MSGNPGESLHYHPLAAVALPAATLGAWHVATGWPSSPSARKCLAVISAILVVALVAVWVARFFGAFGGPVYVRRFWER